MSQIEVMQRRGLDSGVRVAATAREPHQPRPVPVPAKILPCDFRGPAAIGRLVCNCSGSAVVWECTQPQIAEHNGMCIPLTPRKWLDGPLKRTDGTTSTDRYIPLPQGGEMRKNGICLCENCPHRKVAEKYVAPLVWQPQPTWSPELRFVRNSDLTNDTMELVPQLPSDVIGVIGIPVSGMIPAALLSRMLCVPLYSFDFKEGVVSVGDGRRSRSLSRKEGVYLVVDDTVYSGGEMRKARAALQKMDLKCVYAAVYTRDPKAVDIYSVHAPGSIVLEWNIFNSGILAGRTVMPECRGGVCTDFDGVICEEPPVSDLRKPDEFQWWLANARPQYLPRKHEVPLIVSFRIEPWRAVTEAWMARWGVRARKLVLHPSDSIQARNRTHNVAKHKGELFRDSPCGIMFESDPRQARTISEVSGKPVIVPTTGEIFRPDPIKANESMKRFAPIQTRNLIYHVYADQRNQDWLFNVNQMKRRIGLFNGKKVVAIATSPACHSVDVVKDTFGIDSGIEFIEIPNSPELREVATFRPLLDSVFSLSPNEATFYAHTKGNTTSEGTGAVGWRNAMYHHLLDRSDEVMAKLESFKAVGATQMAGPFRYPSGLHCKSKDFWMFAGTFFWFRHDQVFGDERWQLIAKDRYGAESWLGSFLRFSDVYSIFQPWNPAKWPIGSPYNPGYYGKEFNDDAG